MPNQFVTKSASDHNSSERTSASAVVTTGKRLATSVLAHALELLVPACQLSSVMTVQRLFQGILQVASD
jgi:hypothetical protein